MEKLLSVDVAAWRDEAIRSVQFLGKFGDRLPAELHDEHRRVARSEWESHLGEVFREVLGLRGP